MGYGILTDGRIGMKTKAVQDGESQAVVIPKAYRISEADVVVAKVGDSVIL